MNYRQVHLDFHTSEKIAGIGKNFDKKQFQEALKVGHVNSITVFSKCHHGWAYHPTKANEMHPNLDFDLLAAQIEAAHEIGVKTPVYLSAGLDEKYAVKHQEHIVRTEPGTHATPVSFTAPGYHKLCINTPYLDTLLAQIKEVCENYDADGIFLDIVKVQPCYCQTCRDQLIEERKDPDDINNIMEQAEKAYANYTRRVRETIDSVKPGLPVFHNGGHIRKGRRDLAYMDTHLELESLPTGGWGYDHFPVSAAYARTLGMEYLGMTGKFHTSWGEFGGFKHPNALRYEAALSIANGAKCSVGDQLHPDGSMDMATYTLIGSAYKEVEEKEPYLEGAENIIDIAVLGMETITNYMESNNASMAGSIKTANQDAGCARILLEGKYLFDYIDTETSLDKYKLLILPDAVILDEVLKEKISKFVEAGGKILASGKSATDGNGNFLFDFGCRFGGENEYRPDYLRPRFELPSLQNSAYIMYCQGYNVESVTGEVLADRENPYFNRTAEHFCSHRHAPNNKAERFPAIVEGKDGAYIAWDIFDDYAVYGNIVNKQVVCYVLDKLLADKSLKTSLPAQGVVTLTKQENRKVAHLLYASPVRRGKNIEIIEDIIPVYDIDLAVKHDGEVKRVYLAPQNVDIAYQVEDGYVKCKVDKLENHQMVVIE